MGAVLAAVVHAPLAAILILVEISQREGGVILPAMLACVVATGVARLIFKDSVYTLALRRRGVKVATGSDLTLLRRLTIEQVELEPVTAVSIDASFQKLLDITAGSGATDFVVLDRDGSYAGMVVADDIKTALLEHEAIPLLLVGEMLRTELPCVKSTDDLATVLETFSQYDVSRLPVSLANSSRRVIGLISRQALMRRYHAALTEGG
jgi:CIC family chloride channel protein